MKRYEIHDNGGTPFLVDVGEKDVIVFKQEYDDETDGYKAPKKVFKKSFEAIFVGDKPKWQRPGNWRPDFVGNTILLQLKGNKYVFIGPSIREFKPMKGDTIVEYFSEIGNSDVPYAHAVGTTHLYFFSANEREIFAVPIQYFDMTQPVYEQFWLDLRIHDCKHQPRMRNTDLCKRWKKGDPDLKAQLDFLIQHKISVPHKIIHERLF